MLEEPPEKNQGPIDGRSAQEAAAAPDELQLLSKARQSALQAVRVYNDPVAGFRTETFIVLMVIAWNALFQAMLERDQIDCYERDAQGREILIEGRPKVCDTWALAGLAIPQREMGAVRANLDFFLRLRHRISHRYVPVLDLHVISEAQAMLLNFENLLAREFGEDAALGDQLAVPLQLSGFREASRMRSLRAAQAQLPVDVQDFLRQHRLDVEEEILRSSEYALPIFFVPVAANRERSADAVVRFVRPGDVSPELATALEQLAVVPKPKRVPVASDDPFRPMEVMRQVGERVSVRFTTDIHQRAWKFFNVRPPTGAADPTTTDDKYCRWDRLLNGYGYTSAWIDKLVGALNDPNTYRQIVEFKAAIPSKV
jgi:hypothetical protein